MLSATDFLKDSRSFDFFLKALERLFKRFTVFDNNFGHAFFTPLQSGGSYACALQKQAKSGSRPAALSPSRVRP
jgi:hypothetical protein